ncbi:MAG: winged helix-turn-helix domain-containing protein [Anaerolineae bacterium]|jgi:hypothetical protein
MIEPFPPSYVNVPVSVAYAEADDALIVTMNPILGLSWSYDYERTPALTPEQLAEHTGRPRSTLYRHLKLLRELQWIRVDQAGRRIIIRPLITRCSQAADRDAARPGRPSGEPGGDAAGAPAPNEALLQALADIGVENPKRDQLAGLDIDPLWVQAWQLWAKHPHRRTLTNPVGNIILKLESGERPPGEFLRAAEEEIRLRQWLQQQEEARRREVLDDHNQLESEASLQDPEEDGLSEARRLRTRSLEELRLQMTRATFDTWLRGSQVAEANDECLTIAVQHIHAVDWLPEGVVVCPDLPSGEVLATRYPIRTRHDVQIWNNVQSWKERKELGYHAPNEAEHGRILSFFLYARRHKGAVFMSHATAKRVGGDFDGDVFQLMPVTHHKPLDQSQRHSSGIDKPNRDWSDLAPLADQARREGWGQETTTPKVKRRLVTHVAPERSEDVTEGNRKWLASAAIQQGGHREEFLVALGHHLDAQELSPEEKQELTESLDTIAGAPDRSLDEAVEIAAAHGFDAHRWISDRERDLYALARAHNREQAARQALKNMDSYLGQIVYAVARVNASERFTPAGAPATEALSGDAAGRVFKRAICRGSAAGADLQPFHRPCYPGRG